LWANLGEAVERIVLAHRACLDEPAPEPFEAQPGDTADGQPAPTEPDSTAPVEYGSASWLETRTRERHTAVTELRDKGYSLNAICRELGQAFRTVQRFAHAATPEDLLVTHRTRSHKLDRFKSYVHQRWNAGVTEASVLHTELVELGWTGSLRSVQRYLQRFRDPDRKARPAPPAPVKATPRRVTSWIMTNPEHLSSDDKVRLKQILARCP
jgi:hypothetical protein